MSNQNPESQVTILNARASYLHCFKPKAFSTGEGDPKYSVSILLDKKRDKEQIIKIQDIINGQIKAKLQGKKLPPDKVCLRDGDLKDDPEYAGKVYVTASSAQRPAVVDRNKKPLLAEDGRPYSGCYCDFVIRIWAQDNQYGKRVNASLEVIRFVKDGDPFGAPPVDVDSALPDLDDDDDSGLE